MQFKRGGDESIDASNAQRGGGFRKTHFFNLADGEQAFLRYITDWGALYFCKMHQMFPTKNKPADFTGTNWPENMSTVCRYDEIFGGFYKDCYPCDHPEIVNKWGRPYKATVRDWVVAILREEVIGTQEMADQGAITADQVGLRIGFRDATREVEIPKRDRDGKPIEGENETVIEPAFVIVNMAPNNYFDALGAMAAAYEGTICDRDYLVRCKGEGKDKTFTHAPMKETPNLKPGTEKWQAKYLDPIAKINEEGGSLDIEKLIAHRASDEYMARFIDPDKVDTSQPKGGKGGTKESAPDVPESPDDSVDEEKLKSLRARVREAGGAQAPSADALADVD